MTRGTRNRSINGPLAWVGTLIDGMRDNSGQMYMRNRSYDEWAGQHPRQAIGLAAAGFLLGAVALVAPEAGTAFLTRLGIVGTRATTAAATAAGIASKVQFGSNANQVYHAFRHVTEAGLDPEEVRDAVLQHLPHGCRSASARQTAESGYHSGQYTTSVHCFPARTESSMSDGSTQFGRPMPDQVRLLRALLMRANQLDVDEAWLDQVLVQPMDDGDMGSFRIRGSNQSTGERTYGAVAAELQFNDADGAVVLVSLNTDSTGAPFEVDVWRTDFKPVIRFPQRFDP